MLGGEEAGRDPADPLRALRRALAFDPYIDQRIGTLSQGMRQRLAIFCAFLARPRAVLLDEPFNWLDPISAFDTKAALAGLVAQGLTLVTALHDIASLVRQCEAGLLLSDGRSASRLGAADIDGRARATYAGLRSRIIASAHGALGSGGCFAPPHRLKAANASLEKPDLVTTNVKWRWPSVHPEGPQVRRHRARHRRPVLVGDRLGLARLARRSALTFGIAAFFRDPIRTTPVGRGPDRRPRGRPGDDDHHVPPPRELWGEGGLPRSRSSGSRSS